MRPCDKFKQLIGAKCLVAELTLFHAQSAWGSRGVRVRTAELTACCNYFSKKRKRKKRKAHWTI